MMIDCPRCGFAQPKDRFCANCGLDIDNYQPEKPSWQQTLVRSPFFHLSLIVVLIVGVVSYIKSRPPSFEDTPTSVEEFMPPAEQDVAPEPEAKPEPVERNESTTSPNTPTAAQPPPPRPTDPAPPPTKPSTATQSAYTKKERPSDAKEVTNTPTSFSIRFAEVELGYLSQVMSEGQGQPGGTNFRAFTLKGEQSSATLNSSGSLRFLPGTRTQRIKLNEPATLNFTTTDDAGESVGLNMQIITINATSDLVGIEMEVLINIQGATEGDFISSSSTGRFEIPTGETLVIAGVVPHSLANEDQLDQLSSSPLNIMTSQEFLENATEFLILIQPQ